MKAFITGGAGFIGSNLVDMLIEEGHTVTVYDNLSSGKKDFLKHYFENDKFKFIHADILDFEKLKDSIKEHDVVFHFAANPDVLRGLKETNLDLKQNAVATYNVLEAMRLNNINKIVFSSSGTVYGNTGKDVADENYSGKLTISLYAASKVYSENLISAFCHIFNFRAWIFRFANIIGKRQTHGVIFDFIKKLKKNPDELLILGDGHQTKHYLYVEDCIKGIFFGLNNSKEQLNIFNLASEGTCDVNFIAKSVIKGMELKNVKLKYTGSKQGWKGDVPVSYLSAGKICNLGWKPEFNSEEAVNKTVNILLNK
ncbi:NAD-dependent epimerase/dehydratase family protein [Candidatus Woesearchaeota archaeon]|nr:NAD-dependent epimerase/dehydratase family protein [Candidatus Woesearchaeota archaeon]